MDFIQEQENVGASRRDIDPENLEDPIKGGKLEDGVVEGNVQDLMGPVSFLQGFLGQLIRDGGLPHPAGPGKHDGPPEAGLH